MEGSRAPWLTRTPAPDASPAGSPSSPAAPRASAWPPPAASSPTAPASSSATSTRRRSTPSPTSWATPSPRSRCDVTVEDDVGRAGRRSPSSASAASTSPSPTPAPPRSPRSSTSTWREWSRVLDVNLTGPFLTIKHAGRRMDRGGSIIATASLNAVQSGNGMGAYCVSKAGVAMLVEVAAIELGPKGHPRQRRRPRPRRHHADRGRVRHPGRRRRVRGEHACSAATPSPTRSPTWWPSWRPTRPASSPGRCTWSTAAPHTKRYPDIPARIADLGG